MVLYWMNEESGKMKEIVLKFLKDELLTLDQLNTLRWYIHQFADAMPNKPLDLNRIFQLDQTELKEYNFRVLVCEFGIDVL